MVKCPFLYGPYSIIKSLSLPQFWVGCRYPIPILNLCPQIDNFLENDFWTPLHLLSNFVYGNHWSCGRSARPPSRGGVQKSYTGRTPQKLRGQSNRSIIRGSGTPVQRSNLCPWICKGFRYPFFNLKLVVPKSEGHRVPLPSMQSFPQLSTPRLLPFPRTSICKWLRFFKQVWIYPFSGIF